MISKISATVKFPVSDALIFILKIPVIFGVPVKVRVLASKLSQEGNEVPSASVALYVRKSPTSGSVKVLGLTA